MGTPQQKLAAEQRAVANKIDELSRFIGGPMWPEVDRRERGLLVRELSVLEALDHVLLERMALPPKT